MTTGLEEVNIPAEPSSIYVFGKDEVLKTEIPFTDVLPGDKWQREVRNFLLNYKFSIPLQLETGQYLEEEGLLVIKHYDGHFYEYRIYDIQEDKEKQTKTIKAESSHLELNKEWVRPLSLTLNTAEEWLDALLSPQDRWQRGIVESTLKRSGEINDYPSVTTGINQKSGDFEVEVRYRVILEGSRIVTRYVDWVEHLGEENPSGEFVYKENITGLKRIGNTEEMFTAYIGLGKTNENEEYMTFSDVEWSVENGDPVDKPLGQDWVGDPQALAHWGYMNPDGSLKHVVGKHESEADTPESVLQHTWEVLRRDIGRKLTYEVGVFLLGQIIGYESKKVNLGDTVPVKDRSFIPEILLTSRIIAMEGSYVDRNQDKATLGDYKQLQQSTYSIVQEMQSKLFRKSGVLASVQANLDDMRNFTDEAFRDGIISQAEAMAIEKYMNTINSEKEDIDQRYALLYNNVYLQGSPKTVLSAAKTEYDTAHSNLLESIQDAIEDYTATPAESAQVDDRFNTYAIKLSTYSQAEKEAQENMSSNYTNAYAEKKRVESSSAPADKSVIWIDTSGDEDVWKRWSESDQEWKAGPSGPQGVQGPPGEDGQSLFTWVKYADDIQGSNMADIPDGKEYIGLAYNQVTSVESNNPDDYTWAQLKGDQGLQGPTGDDGRDHYTWLKYADSPTSGMSDNPDGKTYMGLSYNNSTPTESTDYDDYLWSKIQGPQGETGAQGPRGIQGIQGPQGDQGVKGAKGDDGVSSYTHIAYSNNSTGTSGFSVSDPTNKTYIGVYVDSLAS